ncbi:MAG: phage tail tape measure protein [Synergistaceae bacterium]|jgi:hypothetical protein|nr:phage tail tape measure protein [Synergistaceae bacterium]
MSVEELTAMMTVMADAGMQGEMIGTTIRNIAMKIASSTEVMGVSTRDAAGNMRSMIDVMRDISQTGAGFAEFAETFKARGANGALILSRNIDNIAQQYNMLMQVSNEASEQVEKQTQTWGNVVKSFESRVESLYLTIYDQINMTAKGTKDALTGMVFELDKWVEETGIAKQALDAFIEGLSTGLGFEIPDGSGFQEWLQSLDLEDITSQFKSFGLGVSGVANAISGLASAVPWELLATNLDLIAKVAFWSMIINRGTHIVQTLLQTGDAMRMMAQGTAEAFTTTTAVTVANTAATTANTVAQNLATAAMEAQAEATRQAALAKEATEKAAIAAAEAMRFAVQSQIMEGYNFVDAVHAQTMALETNSAAIQANAEAKQQMTLAAVAQAEAIRAEQAALVAQHGTIVSNLKVTATRVTGLSKVAGTLGNTLKGLATNPMIWVFTMGPALYSLYDSIRNYIEYPLKKAEERAKKAEQAIRNLKKIMDKVEKGEKLDDEDYGKLTKQQQEFIKREEDRQKERRREAEQYKFLIDKIKESMNNLMGASDAKTFENAAHSLEDYLKQGQEFSEELKEAGKDAKAIENIIGVGMQMLADAPKNFEKLLNPENVKVFTLVR